MPNENPFEPMDAGGGSPHDRGEPATKASDIAREAAAAAVRGQNTVSPGSSFREGNVGAGGEPRDEALPSETSQFAQFEQVDDAQPSQQDGEGESEQQSQQGEPAQQGQQQTEPQQPTAPAEWVPAEYNELQEWGVDLPVSPDEVPEDFRDAYSDLVTTLYDNETSVRSRVRDTTQAVEQIKDFAQRLQTPEGQKRLLLSMAFQNPDVLNESLETIQRVQEDPEYAESVRRQLEADIKLEAAQRAQRAMQQEQLTTKGRQVENRTVRLAKRLGVDPDWAKEAVVNRIYRNEAENGQRDISFEEVDAVVRGLAQRAGTKQRAKSPQTQQRQKQANTQRATGTGREQTQQSQRSQQQSQSTRATREASPGENAIDGLRSAVRLAAENVRAKGL